jgi:hypothetical protein
VHVGAGRGSPRAACSSGNTRGQLAALPSWTLAAAPQRSCSPVSQGVTAVTPCDTARAETPLCHFATQWCPRAAMLLQAGQGRAAEPDAAQRGQQPRNAHTRALSAPTCAPTHQLAVLEVHLEPGLLHLPRGKHRRVAARHGVSADVRCDRCESRQLGACWAAGVPHRRAQSPTSRSRRAWRSAPVSRGQSWERVCVCVLQAVWTRCFAGADMPRSPRHDQHLAGAASRNKLSPSQPSMAHHATAAQLTHVVVAGAAGVVVVAVAAPAAPAAMACARTAAGPKHGPACVACGGASRRGASCSHHA